MGNPKTPFILQQKSKKSEGIKGYRPIESVSNFTVTQETMVTS